MSFAQINGRWYHVKSKKVLSEKECVCIFNKETNQYEIYEVPFSKLLEVKDAHS